MARFLLLTLCLSQTAAVTAQPSERTEAVRLRPPALVARAGDEGPATTLDLRKLHARVEIAGRVVATQLDLVFHNPHHRDLEGEFLLHLPAGSWPTAFAMEIGGSLREGVIVEKQTARVVVEEIERQQVDPGLLEWVQGNVFRARVYPVPAGGEKRIEVRYEEEVAPGTGSAYRLPLAMDSAIGDVRVDVTNTSSRAVEVVEHPFRGPPRAEGESLYFVGEALTPEHDLVIAVERPATVAEVVLAEQSDGRQTFVIDVAPPTERRQRPKPNAVAVLWDSSFSRSEAATAKELRLLSRFLTHLGQVAVELIVFSDDLWFRESYTIEDGDATVLVARIRGLVPDGGTRFDAIDPRAIEADRVLLFSDGMGTIGHDFPSFASPVDAISAASQCAFDVLERVAARGVAIDLGRVDPARALRALMVEPVTAAGISGTPGLIEDVVWARDPRAPGHLRVAGHLKRHEAGDAIVVNRLGDLPLRLALDAVPLRVDPGVAERMWARTQLMSWRVHLNGSKDQVIALSKRTQLVTSETSFVVLETLDDYVRFRIEPPEAMREAYLEIVAELDGEPSPARTRDEQLAHLRALWNERVAWWSREFDLDAKPKGTEGQTRSFLGPRLALDEDDLSSAFGFEMEGGGSDEVSGPSTSFRIAPWKPDSRYARAYRARPDHAYALYHAYRARYGSTPGFYLDTVDFFLTERNDRATALRVLSNLAELELTSPPLLRILGHRYQQLGAHDRAADVFRRVLELRPEEPQSYRDLARLLAEQKQYAEAIALLEKIALGTWDGRFPEVELIALAELGEIVERCRRETGGRHHTLPDDLVKCLDADLRIVCTWDADLTDIDFWVTEPSGERAYYDHRRTLTGGWFSADFTGGYGPEEYTVHRAVPGEYLLQIHYYGESQVTLAGPTTVQIEIVRHFGRPNEERVRLTRRLESAEERLEIGRVSFP